jgi:hypothetical protein
MIKMLLLVLLSFMAHMFSATYTVDGYAFLEGETDHSGIEVFFQRVAPDSLISYTVYTDSTGYYSKEIESGWYEAYFTKNYWFLNNSLTNLNGYSDITLTDVTLLKRTTLSGSIYGKLPKGEYEVSSSLTVEYGDTLVIDPGVTLKFHTGTELIVNGSLFAEGNDTDSIKFTSMQSSNWNGIKVLSADHKPYFSYCVISYSVQRGVHSDSGLDISNSHIFNNYSAYDYGAGISAGNAYITDCLIENNEYYHGSASSETVGGGGFYGSGSIKNCIVRNNTSSRTGGGVKFLGGIIIEDCIIEGNSARDGGGLSSYSGEISGSIRNCVIRNNTSSYRGGGIYHQSWGYLDYVNNIITGNVSVYGGGIYYYSLSSSDISNNIICNNTGGGIYCFNSEHIPNLYSSCVYGNTYSDYYNCGDYIGVSVTINSNGDPCDAWSNISLDPVFVDAANGDFRLQSDSPCIDAGTNTITDYEFPLADLAGNYRIWDGDGNESVIVDMGPYEYGAPSGIEGNPVTIQDCQLYQNFPNPFNPVTTISYALPKAAQVELNIFNMNGQLVQSLVNGKQEKGIHKAEFNARDLTSGLYIYNLKADGKVVQSRKMMLIK